MIERFFDKETGFIRVKVTGQWEASEVDDHFKKLRNLIAMLRAKNLPIRVLVDVRDAPNRSALIEARISSRKKALYQPGDRVAILTSSYSEKAHVRSFLDGAEVWAWQSELAAEQWLFLDEIEQNMPQHRSA